jgi:hypothetical protein
MARGGPRRYRLDMGKDWRIFAVLGVIAAIWLALIVGYYVYKAKFQPHYKNYNVTTTATNRSGRPQRS